MRVVKFKLANPGTPQNRPLQYQVAQLWELSRSTRLGMFAPQHPAKLRKGETSARGINIDTA